MGRKKKSRNPMDYVTLPDFEINDRAKRSIIIVVILALGIISFLGLLNLSGHFGQFVSKMLTLGFGYDR